MSNDSSLRWGHLRADMVPAWAELSNLLARVDETEEFYDAEDLAEELTEEGFAAERDSWAVWAEDRLIGYGQLRVGMTLDHQGRVRCHLGGGVHPDWRGRGIGRRLMDLMEARARERAEELHPGVPALWRVSAGIEGASVRRLAAHRGYRIVRYFNALTRPLPGDDLADLPLPEGVVLVSPEPGHAEPVRVAHNIAFADHWGSTPSNEGRWRDLWRARSNRFEVSTLALDPAGQVLAYVLCGQWLDRELYVNLVGTIPDARRRGLAAACLARTIQFAGASGDYDVVELDVDSDSVTGATRLYQRLGFSLVRSTAVMQRDAAEPSRPAGLP